MPVKEEDTFFKSNFSAPVESISLPFYVFATGVNTSGSGHVHEKRGILNSTIQILWSLRGIGEVELFGKRFQLRENDVFYYLPGEDRWQRPLSQQWTHRWLTLYGVWPKP